MNYLKLVRRLPSKPEVLGSNPRASGALFIEEDMVVVQWLGTSLYTRGHSVMTIEQAE
ncbi:hypothetical protein J6590_104440 [Homalodisca vitripennis]|nr:hypothetical protein J6590_104440 [Homalodisca vitripennis]